MKAEALVEGEVIKNIKLKGKIDRIDIKIQNSKLKAESSKNNKPVTDNEVELIDYKTGAAQLSRAEILNKGASLQLFLYAALMKSLGFKVTAQAYTLSKTPKSHGCFGKKTAIQWMIT